MRNDIFVWTKTNNLLYQVQNYNRLYLNIILNSHNIILNNINQWPLELLCLPITWVCCDGEKIKRFDELRTGCKWDETRDDRLRYSGGDGDLDKVRYLVLKYQNFRSSRWPEIKTITPTPLLLRRRECTQLWCTRAVRIRTAVCGRWRLLPTPPEPVWIPGCRLQCCSRSPSNGEPRRLLIRKWHYDNNNNNIII